MFSWVLTGRNSIEPPPPPLDTLPVSLSPAGKGVGWEPHKTEW